MGRRWRMKNEHREQHREQQRPTQEQRRSSRATWWERRGAFAAPLLGALPPPQMSAVVHGLVHRPELQLQR